MVKSEVSLHGCHVVCSIHISENSVFGEIRLSDKFGLWIKPLNKIVKDITIMISILMKSTFVMKIIFVLRNDSHINSRVFVFNLTHFQFFMHCLWMWPVNAYCMSVSAILALGNDWNSSLLMYRELSNYLWLIWISPYLLILRLENILCPPIFSSFST